MLAMGKALMLRPALFVLDEPSTGLSPNYVRDVFRKIQKIQRQGTAILLVEQNARVALKYATYVYVFDTGRIVKESPAHALIRDPEIQKIYLGA